MNKLPVIQSFQEVFAGVTRHYFELIRVAPFAVTLILSGYLVMFIASPAEPAGEEPFRHALAIAVVVTAFVVGFPSAAVRWHRFVLFGERPADALASFWGRDQSLYCLNMVKLMLLMGVVVAATMLAVFGIGAGIAAALGGVDALSEGGKAGFGAVAVVAAVIVYLALIYLAARLTVAFPAAAIGQDASFRKAMEDTRGNGWRLLGYTLLVQLVVVIAVTIFGVIVGAIAGGVIAVLLTPEAVEPMIRYIDILTLPAILYQLMIGVTMMSVAYREIVGLPQHSAPDAPGDEAGFHPV
ncbi:hypothetical protein [Parvibaculum sp.]|uniref:hypothetical protein n=1 Tax=Parvibaculum sp. TaxID=2024848 RepID=UPI00320FF376